MTRRLLASACLAALVLAAPAAGDDVVGQKASVDARIAELHQHVARTRASEEALKGEIADVTVRIRSLEQRVGDVSLELRTLERDLALHRARLDKLTELYDLQTRRLGFVRRQYAAAQDRLDRRLVDIYESDDPDAIAVVLSASSMQEALDQIDYMKQIGTLDKRVAAEVGRAKVEVKLARDRTERTKASVASETHSIAIRTGQQREVRDGLVAAQGHLSVSRAQQQVSLSQLSEQERQEVSEAEALEQQSAALAARIRAAQTGGSSQAPAPSGNGTFIWPVSGPVTSPFGMRWGRMHEGIDIAAPSGTPIKAAGSGTVIYSGWMEGYGNLVVIDHGNGLATAYAHQSAIAAALGQHAAQGQVIGYVGSTGHSFGPHLHFEVRVNGVPVDPLGYL